MSRQSTAGNPDRQEDAYGNPVAKPRHDEALLRIYLSNMPPGKYHQHTDGSLMLDGVYIGAFNPSADGDLSEEDSNGLVAALVHLLNSEVCGPAPEARHGK